MGVVRGGRISASGRSAGRRTGLVCPGRSDQRMKSWGGGHSIVDPQGRLVQPNRVVDRIGLIVVVMTTPVAFLA